MKESDRVLLEEAAALKATMLAMQSQLDRVLTLLDRRAEQDECRGHRGDDEKGQCP